MNWMLVLLGFLGFIVFVAVVAVIVAAIQSVRSKDACHVELDVPEYYGYTGKIIAHVESFAAATAVVEQWRAMVDRSERPETTDAPHGKLRESLERRGLLP